MARRGVLLTLLAAVFAALAVEDFLKPFHLEGPDTAIVFLGHPYKGAAAFLGWLVAIFLILYAIGIWRMRRYALTMAYIYAVYVVVNIVTFTVTHAAPAQQGQRVFAIAYAILATGGACLAAILLRRRRAALV
jgi:hypothetical protein